CRGARLRIQNYGFKTRTTVWAVALSPAVSVTVARKVKSICGTVPGSAVISGATALVVATLGVLRVTTGRAGETCSQLTEVSSKSASCGCVLSTKLTPS